ncbi:hypothetical protein [Salinithrix halophila]|uniref:Uncharacterized protein n=1 Tax=Salinithrix halophila TaxID=1485204 RepID=A0ABV8JA74_9BACL
MIRNKHAIALAAALLMLVFAVPRLPVGGETDIRTIFTASWLAFAYLVIAANWRAVLRLDREVQRRNEQVRRRRWLQARQRQSSGRSKKGVDFRRSSL